MSSTGGRHKIWRPRCRGNTCRSKSTDHSTPFRALGCPPPCRHHPPPRRCRRRRRPPPPPRFATSSDWGPC
jgi:hypothetical protein